MRDLEENESLSDSEPASQTQNTKINSYPQPNGSIDTISLYAPSQSSQASDLYDFVGITQQQQQQQHHRNNNNSHENKRGSSAEERLHNLLGDLQKGERNKVSIGHYYFITLLFHFITIILLLLFYMLGSLCSIYYCRTKRV